MNEKEYLRQLNDIIDSIYLHWKGSWVDFAIEANLSISTVYNLGCRKTKRPQLRTILKLAKAARMKIEFDFTQLRKKKVA